MSTDCFAPEIVATLETLICPGAHSRLSPFVEAAQLQVLGFSGPGDRRMAEAVGHWLRANSHLPQQWAATLSERRVNHANSFSRVDYSDETWLRAYLSYYYPLSVAKLQILFLDLVRMRRLRGPIRLMDIGVGTGATFVAFLDFALAWRQVCELNRASFPLDSVEFLGLDRSHSCLDLSRDVLTAFGQAVGESRLGNLLSAIKSARFQQLDLNSNSYRGDFKPTLVVAANVLNELIDAGRGGEEHLRQSLKVIGSGGVAVIIEPADEKNATRLSEWRATLLDTDPWWRTLGPCVPEQAVGPRSCKCWNCRRESLHEPAVSEAVRKELDRLSKARRGTGGDFENNLLKWSYMILERSADPIRRAENAASRLQLKNGQVLTEPLKLVFLGRCRKSKEDGSREDLHPNPSSDSAQGSEPQSGDYIRTCPGMFGNAQDVLVHRKLGLHLPPIRYGGAFSISGLKVHEHHLKPQHFWLEAESDPQINVDEPPLRSRTFIDTEDYDSIAPVLDQLANRLFGFDNLRPFQHRILQRVLAGRSILAIAATGGGKSECFILPAMLLPGLTIVVSPLKALMTDQYEQRIKGRYELHHVTTWLNGDINIGERMKRLNCLENGFYKLAYFTPEQLERSYVLDSLERANRTVGVRYLAMDEAHCISQWGHDFRPSYLNVLRRLKSRRIQPCVIALTATASEHVRADICEELQLNPAAVQDGGDVYIDSSNRPELNLAVYTAERTEQKVAHMIDLIRSLLRDNRASNGEKGAVIVFMPHTGGNPKDTPQQSPTAGRLSAGVSPFAAHLEWELGCQVSLYHGKMDNDVEPSATVRETPTGGKRELGDVRGRDRRTEQMAFIRGDRDIMVATKGFGMGVDKPNIRLVLHRSPPGNLEAYAQEAGRAGRDGRAATVVLYYSPDSPSDEGADRPEQSDHEIQQYFLDNKYIHPQDIRIMRAFFARVNRFVDAGSDGSGKPLRYLYFTNDEAIEFFNSCISDAGLARASFAWPTFPPRRPIRWESGDHKQILDRGYLYQQRTGYIRRILAVLYKLRPVFEGERLVFIESCQEVKSCVAPVEVRHWEAICTSNLYFGVKIKQSGISEEEFTSLVNQPDLLPLATRLSMPVSEVVAMLNDIKNAEAKDGRLIDFKNALTPLYGPAKGRESVTAWRDYAGATRRAPDAKQRAEREGRKPSLDDWFNRRDLLPYPVGWEVRLGPAMMSGSFDKYLRAFVEFHDARKENDWRSYQYLVTEYIGANPDGRLSPPKKKRGCLRAALLGYLKTGEVIVGGNCKSCSVCVPDWKFERYSLEERRAVVARLHADTERLLDKIAAAVTQDPAARDLDDLFAMIEAEEREGRSLLRYVTLWSARLIEDNTGHRGATSFRFEGMRRGLLDFDDAEFVSAIKTLSAGCGAERTRLLMQELDRNRDRIRQSPDVHWLRANLARALGAHDEEEISLDAVVASRPQLELLRTVLDRLIEMHGCNGTRPNPSRLVTERLQRGWASESAREAELWLADLIKDWSWEDVRTQFDMAMSLRAHSGAAGMLSAWIRARRGTAVDQDPLDALERVFAEGASLQTEAALSVLNSAGASAVLTRKALSQGIAQAVFHDDCAIPLSGEALPFAVELLLRGADLPPAAVRRVAQGLSLARMQGTSPNALASQFCERLAAFRKACPSLRKLEGAHFASLWSTFAHGPEVYADMLVQATHALRSKCWNERWKTPISREFEALVKARRYTEAEDLARGEFDLTVKHEPALEYLERSRRARSERNPDKDLLRLYDRLAAALLQ